MLKQSTVFVATALAAGIIGGMVTACLVVLLEPPVPRGPAVLAVALPLLIVTLIAWRLAGRTHPAGRWLTATAAAAVALFAAVAGLPRIGEFTADIPHNTGVLLLILIYGAAAGTLPAAAVILIGLPALLLLPRSYAPATVTTLAMAVTAAYALWLSANLHTALVTGLSTALAGAAVTLTARWWSPEP
ncbi:hypothetical protein [Symbioplanes lichenis]|uniref:hypothetical protein n=1 Tax=Symbioplanes lichenis TaxID=1629072 RepID=UPI002739B561|nr:hypothetical protein [Actinoplanes lichenis]